MKTIACGIAFGAMLLVAGLAVAAAADDTNARPVVTVRSLLEEMTDRDSNARWPSPAYALREASSHDRRKNDPANAATWHSNTDYGQFIRTETNEGRKEWVILDDQGPGAITRFWAPLLAEKDSMRIRFYFDGATKPAIEAKFNDLVCGQGFVAPPLAFVAWNDVRFAEQSKPSYKGRRGVAGDMYLPIPFAKSCKITLDQVPFYYVINYRMYEPGTEVTTFSKADFGIQFHARHPLESLDFKPTVNAGPALRRTLAPGAEASIDFPAGSGAVRGLQVQIDPNDAPLALRSLVLEGTFDGESTIWCPIGDFFGAGVRLNPVMDWNRTVEPGGTLTARWVMPYEKSGRLTLKNVGKKSLNIGLAADTKPWKWDDRSLHFHANWHCELGMKTRPIFDWNYIEITGRGLYVGDTLTVHSDVSAWYGEGDERIAIDGERVPSQIGTGTEDYYGYAWGMAGFFSSPFISMPQRDSSGQDWRGYTTTSRLRLLDAIPFRGELRHNMEIWNWADTRIDYAVATFWYGRPGAKSNRPPQPAEAAAAIKAAPIDPSKYKIGGAIECETMPIVAHSPGLQISAQDAGLQSGMWSGGKQLFVQAKKNGDFVELQFPASGDQPRQLTLYATKSYDYGILRFQVDGQTAGKDYDAYDATAIASGPIELGTFAPKDGKYTLRVEVVGANHAARAPAHFFGLDCVQLAK